MIDPDTYQVFLSQNCPACRRAVDHQKRWLVVVVVAAAAVAAAVAVAVAET